MEYNFMMGEMTYRHNDILEEYTEKLNKAKGKLDKILENDNINIMEFWQGLSDIYDDIEEFTDIQKQIDISYVKERLSSELNPKTLLLILGPNTHQYWLYSDELDIYIDPPIEVLEQLDKSNQDKAEETLMEILSENPKWLYEKEYWYDIEDI